MAPRANIEILAHSFILKIATPVATPHPPNPIEIIAKGIAKDPPGAEAVPRSFKMAKDIVIAPNKNVTSPAVNTITADKMIPTVCAIGGLSQCFAHIYTMHLLRCLIR
jgi:hypothetical protein